MIKKCKVVIVGNCQAAPLGRVLALLSSDVEVLNIATVHKLADDDEAYFSKDFMEADYIISQPISENYRCKFVRTNVLQKKFNNKLIKVVNLYYAGYHPDWAYIKDNNGVIVTGPMTDYHNKTILNGWKEDKGITEIVADLNSIKYNEDRYTNLIRSTIDELETRESEVDVCITDLIKSECQNQQLFFTFNHPSKFLLVEYAKRILSHINMQFVTTEIAKLKEPLDRIILPINPASNINKRPRVIKGVDFTSNESGLLQFSNDPRVYSEEDLVSVFLQVYESALIEGTMEK